MRKAFATSFVIIIVGILIGILLIDPSKPYRFRQDTDNIISIEILEQPFGVIDWEHRFVVRKVLDEKEFDGFISGLTALKGQPFFNPPATGLGKYVIRITYADGEEEYISRSNNGYKSPGKDMCQDTYYFSDSEGFYNLISDCLGEYSSDDFKP